MAKRADHQRAGPDEGRNRRARCGRTRSLGLLSQGRRLCLRRLFSALGSATHGHCSRSGSRSEAGRAGSSPGMGVLARRFFSGQSAQSIAEPSGNSSMISRARVHARARKAVSDRSLAQRIAQAEQDSGDDGGSANQNEVGKIGWYCHSSLLLNESSLRIRPWGSASSFN